MPPTLTPRPPVCLHPGHESQPAVDTRSVAPARRWDGRHSGVMPSPVLVAAASKQGTSLAAGGFAGSGGAQGSGPTGPPSGEGGGSRRGSSGLSLTWHFPVFSSASRKTYKEGHGHRQAEAWKNFENSSERKTAPLKFGKPGSFCSAQDPRSPARTSAPRRVATLPHPGEGLAPSRPPLPPYEHLLLQQAELTNVDRRPFSSCLE